MLALGPIPEAVRRAVGRVIAETERGELRADGERLKGLFLAGGPGGSSYLDAEGEVWNWSAWDDSIELVPDGPIKVGIVAVAAECMPELAAWLPARPSGASECGPCHGSGSLPLPWPRIQCPKCLGMGWVPAENTGQQCDPADAPTASR
jgi:hypothetical protein